jgi:hypothetical protein
MTLMRVKHNAPGRIYSPEPPLRHTGAPTSLRWGRLVTRYC